VTSKSSRKITLKNSEMDTTTINKILTFLFKNNKNVYFDVIPCDYLDKLNVSRYPVCLCVNNQTSNEAGEHWVGLFISNPNGPVEFFCSFGLGMDFYPENFKKFVQRIDLNVIENKTCLQDMTSKVCGMYVIYFLYKRVNKCPLRCVYAPFSYNTSKNDAIVRRIIHVKTNLLSL